MLSIEELASPSTRRRRCLPQYICRIALPILRFEFSQVERSLAVIALGVRFAAVDLQKIASLTADFIGDNSPFGYLFHSLSFHEVPLAIPFGESSSCSSSRLVDLPGGVCNGRRGGLYFLS